MKFYQDITLLPDPETDLYFLWQKVYQQIHLGLVEVKDENNQVTIGLSWPNYQYSPARKHLGNKLRIFASSKAELSNLNIEKWLSRLLDYVHVTQIRAVPESVEYVRFSRKSVKGEARIEKDMQSKAERWAKQSGNSLEMCLEQLRQTKPKVNSDLPFVKMDSQETKKRSPDARSSFNLFIEKVKEEKHLQRKFNCYGLSANAKDKLATVPWF